MTVKELIEKLKQYPEQTNIYFYDSEQRLMEIIINDNYYDFDGNKKLVIEGEQRFAAISSLLSLDVLRLTHPIQIINKTLYLFKNFLIKPY